MDKKLINAVAGSGKTSFLIERLNLDDRFLIITYTENNFRNLKERVIKKFGYFPENIYVQTYFSFIYNFCYRPYLYDEISDNGINYEQPDPITLKLKRTNMRFYLDNSRRLYSNRIAKLLEMKNINKLIKARIEKYFDKLFIDEVQDFAGHDLNFILSISACDCDVVFVGDFFQHTFDTSRDGTVNANIHDSIEAYFTKFKSNSFDVDIEILNSSFRCSKNICEFIDRELGINIQSHREDSTTIQFIDNTDEVIQIMSDDKIVKLFFNNSIKYKCYSMNWGISKGLDCFNDVCVVLNKATYKLFVKSKLKDMNNKSKNKLYVACTRAKNNLYFINEADITAFKF